jgi:hypothetical protein
VLSGIIFINCNGLRRRDVLREYGPSKAVFDCWNRWARWGLRPDDVGACPRRRLGGGLMVQAAHMKAQQVASSLRAKEGGYPKRGRLIGRAKGRLNTALPALTAPKGRPLRSFMTSEQVSDYSGAATPVDSLPAAELPIRATTQLVPQSAEKPWDTLLHPRRKVAQQGRTVRHAKAQAPQTDRDQVQQTLVRSPSHRTLQIDARRHSSEPSLSPPPSSSSFDDQ